MWSRAYAHAVVERLTTALEAAGISQTISTGQGRLDKRPTPSALVRCISVWMLAFIEEVESPEGILLDRVYE